MAVSDSLAQEAGGGMVIPHTPQCWALNNVAVALLSGEEAKFRSELHYLESFLVATRPPIPELTKQLLSEGLAWQGLGDKAPRLRETVLCGLLRGISNGLDCSKAECATAIIISQ